MLRILNPHSIELLSVNFTNLQIVRWRRKPRWLPTAKSKIFRIPPRPSIPEEEKLELKRLYNHYRTQVNSIRNYLDKEYNLRYMQKLDVEQQQKEFEEDFIKCKEINDKWNEEQRIKREQALEERIKSEVEEAKQRLKVRKEIWKKQEMEAEELVRSLKESMKTCITPENLDEAIEHAIQNPVDHNYAIDLDGNKIIGRETSPNVKMEAKN